MRMEIALEMAELDELRQRSASRRLQLAGAQLGRDELVAEELVQLLLVAMGDRLARIHDDDAVLGDREPPALRLLPHGDVVVLRAGEVLEEVAIALGGNDAEVEAEAVPETTVAFVPPRAATSATHGSSVKCAMSASGSRAVAMMSTSRTVSRLRRALPASDTLIAAGWARSSSTASSRVGNAMPSSALSARSHAFLRRGQDVLFAPRPEAGQRAQLFRFGGLL